MQLYCFKLIEKTLRENVDFSERARGGIYEYLIYIDFFFTPFKVWITGHVSGVRLLKRKERTEISFVLIKEMPNEGVNHYTDISYILKISDLPLDFQHHF